METARVDSGQIREAYLWYGNAMFAAATLERSLVNAAAIHRLAAAAREGRELVSDPFVKAAKAGMDDNIKKIKVRLEQHPGLEDRLLQAKDRRNHLAHDFCFHRASDLFAAEPTGRLIEELASDVPAFLDLHDEVVAVSRAIMEEAGMDLDAADRLHVALVEMAVRGE
ncbi:hypothetical protein ACPCTN_02930 [Streptomyces cinereoruber]|uniref:hypothetical protein n=1 Tax=Streptomyces cinereoruber TaxID=67260 RepID=UPI003C30767B